MPHATRGALSLLRRNECALALLVLLLLWLLLLMMLMLLLVLLSPAAVVACCRPSTAGVVRVVCSPFVSAVLV